MDTHIGIVADAFDEFPESFLTDGDALVVVVVIAAMDEVDRFQMELLLKLELEVEAIERVVFMPENHSITMSYLVPVPSEEVPEIGS